MLVRLPWMPLVLVVAIAAGLAALAGGPVRGLSAGFLHGRPAETCGGLG